MASVKSIVPHEVYIHILEYAACPHIRKKDVKHELICKGFLSACESKKNYYMKNYTKDGFPINTTTSNNKPLSYSKYLCNFYREYDGNTILKSLEKCNCCERHKKNKPKHLNDSDWTYEVGEPNQDKNVDCFCSCRQSCRFIFRIHNKIWH